MRLPEPEIQRFNYILMTMKARSYRADLWDAMCLVYPLCTDSAFFDFQNWLIAQGRNIFEKVLENPENLADIVEKAQRTQIFDGRMLDTAQDAYEQKTGEHLPDSAYPPERMVLIGGPLTPEEGLPAKFPRIVAKLGICSDDELDG